MTLYWNGVRAEESRIASAPNSRTHSRLGADQEVRDHAGEDHDADREDQRDHAGRVDLERNEGGVAAVLPVAADPLGMVNRNPALALVDVDDADDRDQRDQDEDDRTDRGCRRANRRSPDWPIAARQARDDATEDDDRDAVADAVLGDQLADPDQQHRSGGHRHQHRERRNRGVSLSNRPKPSMNVVAPAAAGRENSSA